MELARAGGTSTHVEARPVRQASVDKLASVLGEPVRPLGNFIEVREKPPAAVTKIVCFSFLCFLFGGCTSAMFFEFARACPPVNATVGG